jgi:hypothetical protein
MSTEPTKAAAKGRAAPGETPEGGLAELLEAVESGAGLPEVARAAARVLDASVAVIDRSSAVLAVASASPGEEERLLSAGEGVESAKLRVADAVVGEFRYRPRGDAPDPAITRTVSTLLGLELERARSPEWESDRLAGDFVEAVLSRRLTDRGDLLARATELGAELEAGAGVVIARAAPRAAQAGQWRERVLTVAVRALRAAARGSLAAQRGTELAEVVAIAPVADD